MNKIIDIYNLKNQNETIIKMKFYILFLLILNCQSESYSISLNTEYLRGYINFPELNAGETIKLEARILN